MLTEIEMKKLKEHAAVYLGITLRKFHNGIFNQMTATALADETMDKFLILQILSGLSQAIRRYKNENPYATKEQQLLNAMKLAEQILRSEIFNIHSVSKPSDSEKKEKLAFIKALVIKMVNEEYEKTQIAELGLAQKIFNKHREKTAELAIALMHQNHIPKEDFNQLYSLVSGYLIDNDTSEKAYGNCDEMAAYFIYGFMDNYGDDYSICEIAITNHDVSMDGHVFAVVNLDFSKEDLDVSDMDTWNEDALIVDPWVGNILCSIKEDRDGYLDNPPNWFRDSYTLDGAKHSSVRTINCRRFNHLEKLNRYLHLHRDAAKISQIEFEKKALDELDAAIIEPSNKVIKLCMDIQDHIIKVMNVNELKKIDPSFCASNSPAELVSTTSQLFKTYLSFNKPAIKSLINDKTYTEEEKKLIFLSDIYLKMILAMDNHHTNGGMVPLEINGFNSAVETLTHFFTREAIQNLLRFLLKSNNLIDGSRKKAIKELLQQGLQHLETYYAEKLISGKNCTLTHTIPKEVIERVFLKEMVLNLPDVTYLVPKAATVNAISEALTQLANTNRYSGEKKPQGKAFLNWIKTNLKEGRIRLTEKDFCDLINQAFSLGLFLVMDLYKIMEPYVFDEKEIGKPKAFLKVVTDLMYQILMTKNTSLAINRIQQYELLIESFDRLFKDASHFMFALPKIKLEWPVEEAVWPLFTALEKQDKDKSKETSYIKRFLIKQLVPYHPTVLNSLSLEALWRLRNSQHPSDNDTNISSLLYFGTLWGREDKSKARYYYEDYILISFSQQLESLKLKWNQIKESGLSDHIEWLEYFTRFLVEIISLNFINITQPEFYEHSLEAMDIINDIIRVGRTSRDERITYLVEDLAKGNFRYLTSKSFEEQTGERNYELIEMFINAQPREKLSVEAILNCIYNDPIILGYSHGWSKDSYDSIKKRYLNHHQLFLIKHGITLEALVLEFLDKKGGRYDSNTLYFVLENFSDGFHFSSTTLLVRFLEQIPLDWPYYNGFTDEFSNHVLKTTYDYSSLSLSDKISLYISISNLKIEDAFASNNHVLSHLADMIENDLQQGNGSIDSLLPLFNGKDVYYPNLKLIQKAIDILVDKIALNLGEDDETDEYLHKLKALFRDKGRLNVYYEEMFINRLADKLKTQEQSTYYLSSLSKRTALDEGVKYMKTANSVMDTLSQTDHEGLGYVGELLRLIAEDKSDCNDCIEFLLTKDNDVKFKLMNSLKKRIENLSYEDEKIVPEFFLRSNDLRRLAMLDDIYSFFWTATGEQKALAFNYLIITADQYRSKESYAFAYQEAHQKIMEKLFGNEKSEEVVAYKDFLRAYLESLEPSERGFMLAALLTTCKKTSGSKKSFANMLSTLLENKLPEGIKLGQAINSYPETPMDIKNATAHLKHAASKPTRFELWRRIKEVMPEEVLKDYRILEVVGSASYNIAVLVINKQTQEKQVMMLLRKDIKQKADRGFNTLKKAILSSNNFIIKKHKSVMLQILDESIKLSDRETSGVAAKEQFNLAKEKYSRSPETHSDNDLIIQPSAYVKGGDEYRIITYMPGKTFNEFVKTAKKNEVRKIAKAYMLVEIQNWLKGETIDPDRHGGQATIHQEDTTTVLGIFDFGELQLTPSPDESIAYTMKTFAKILNEISSPIDFRKILVMLRKEQLKSHSNSDIDNHLQITIKAFLALQDFSQHLESSDWIEIFRALYEKREHFHPAVKSFLLPATLNKIGMLNRFKLSVAESVQSIWGYIKDSSFYKMLPSMDTQEPLDPKVGEKRQYDLSDSKDVNPFSGLFAKQVQAIPQKERDLKHIKKERNSEASTVGDKRKRQSVNEARILNSTDGDIQTLTEKKKRVSIKLPSKALKRKGYLEQGSGQGEITFQLDTRRPLKHFRGEKTYHKRKELHFTSTRDREIKVDLKRSRLG